MDGQSRKFDPAKGVVNTLLCVTEPRVPLRSNLDDPEDWELPVLLTKVYVGTKYIARNLLLAVQSSSVKRRGALGLVLSLRLNMGTQMGKSQPRARLAGKHTCDRTSLSQILRLGNQVWSLGAVYRESN